MLRESDVFSPSINPDNTWFYPEKIRRKKERKFGCQSDLASNKLRTLSAEQTLLPCKKCIVFLFSASAGQTAQSSCKTTILVEGAQHLVTRFVAELKPCNFVALNGSGTASLAFQTALCLEPVEGKSPDFPPEELDRI